MKAAENIPVNLETQNRIFFFKKYYQLRLKKEIKRKDKLEKKKTI